VRDRDNKLQRAQLRARSKNKFAGGDTQPTVDDQLTRLEEDIRRLKIEFDIFFNGASKRPPYDTKGRVDTFIQRLGDDRTLSFAQRYRLNSLAARYTAFRDLWRRTIQGREEGRDPASTVRTSVKQQTIPSPRATFTCADPTKEIEMVKNLYNALVEAKTKCGEPTADLSFPRFHRLIASKADSLKERLGCERISFSVAVEQGRVSFKAKAGLE
jgi:hypothetical protein